MTVNPHGRRAGRSSHDLSPRGSARVPAQIALDVWSGSVHVKSTIAARTAEVAEAVVSALFTLDDS